ncbi:MULTISPECIES: DUF3667 domain-containing protein [Stenotrophomonas]|jgi:hypothetical protein|uniref:Membrane protein n=1 Tax=Stenotrophomonas acidaminiphila TaxID=128780 RepID=A0A0R0E051_9GAMM|nr:MULTISPECIES: DUF3667 domain-containing protein [Stenotrophomonas]ALJ26820.1 membrane protein [Stenotrophomonas acidaminiphila]KRG83358.1 hypothetical protein ABB33_14125 [Stenotrophomonas acidaminiphila]MCA7025451.1 DUF3667 domain-containing protein [Stenotrophomonas acidaminiphila]MCE4075597.1 DUF3667 domain-containing protein [Stenotrophomonas acidaminiphila]QOF98666.1 DUF3667 domain-containing protein [Stenotrophomonas sp. CW117]
MNPTPDNTAVAEVPAVVEAAHGHGACDNCQAALQGHYCHHCGQSAHNPLKHVGHAIEEVFESFWHLDGRIFRTLRDLLVPGRVALNYLKGQRVGYVQPLRLFVILTLFTFFVGKLTLHVDDMTLNGGDNALFATAQTAQEVEAIRAAQQAAIERQLAASPAATPAFTMAMAALNTAAAQRTAELEGQAQGTTASAMTRAAQAAGQAAGRQHGTFFDSDINGKPWDAQANPVVVPGMPAFANQWLNRRLANGQANVERMGGKTDLYVQAFLTALPGALFFLMPVFALVLRVAYAGRRIGYLEHLVVALYSHAWLMLVLLATFLTLGVTGAIGNTVVNAIGDCILVALWLAVPVYLLWMQQRVYGGRGWATLARYVFIGGIYFWLVLVGVMYAALAGVSS